VDKIGKHIVAVKKIYADIAFNSKYNTNFAVHLFEVVGRTIRGRSLQNADIEHCHNFIEFKNPANILPIYKELSFLVRLTVALYTSVILNLIASSIVISLHA